MLICQGKAKTTRESHEVETTKNPPIYCPWQRAESFLYVSWSFQAQFHQERNPPEPYFYIYNWDVSCVLVTQSCPTLCDPMDCSPPGFSVHGILQARILEWIAIPFTRGTSQPRDRTLVSCIAGRLFTVWATGKSKLSNWDNWK